MNHDTVPKYGIDAPGVVKGLIGAAIALIAFGLVVLRASDGQALHIASWMVIAAGVLPLALSSSMLLYSFAGKYRLRDHLLCQRSWRGDEVVLDIGCGRGLMAIAAAHRVPGGKVIALDIWSDRDLSGNTPEALRKNAGREGVEQRLEIVSGDARILNLPDASVDVVVSVFCIHNIEPEADRYKACREIARVLKPGGMALIADFPGTGPYADVFRDAGLRISGPLRAESIALGIAGYLIASK